MPSDIKHGGLPEIIAEAVLLVVDHAAHLPRLHRHQASPGDTALLLVCLSLTQCFGGSQSPPGKRLASDKICALQAPSMAMLFFQTTRDLTELVGFKTTTFGMLAVTGLGSCSLTLCAGSRAASYLAAWATPQRQWTQVCRTPAAVLMLIPGNL